MSKNHHLPRLVDCVREAAAAGHGGKAGVYARYCLEFGWLKGDGSPNLTRLYRALDALKLKEQRAKRADAGAHGLTRIEAEEIVRWQRDNARCGGKKAMVSLKTAVETLRSNGHILAASVDEETGEVKPLSLSAISHAIESYGLSDKVLNAPAPAMRMRVEHANQVWQVDASLCVLYYLPKDGGLQVMSEVLFNSNKPKNVARIEQERVWRYLVVDVASGAIYVEYVFGGESGVNLSSIFINAMQYRKNEFWGVPKRVYCDPGAAMTGAIFQGLCQQLGIDLQWHLPGNARATGAVEKPQDIVERNFESMLASRPVNSLADLNEAAARWRVKFNATVAHSRHGKPRLSAWMQHIGGHLIAPPSVAVCRSLAYSKPEARKVTQYLTIKFNGKDWDASHYPEVYCGMQVLVALNPWSEDSIRIVDQTAQGMRFFECKLKVENELGYWIDSPVMGEEFKRHAMTPPEKTLAELAKRSAQDQADSEGGKRAKPLPFGGKIDPFKPLDGTYMPEFMPRKADAVHPATASVHVEPLSHIAAIRQLRERLGEDWRAEFVDWLKQRYPDGVNPELIGQIADELRGNGAVKVALKAV